MVKSCCAYGCTSTADISKGVKYHRFPFSRPEILNKWIKRVRRQDFMPKAHTSLCSKHFLDEDYCDGKLKLNAVPSIFNFSAVSSRPSPKILAPEPSPSPEPLPPQNTLEVSESIVTDERLKESLEELKPTIEEIPLEDFTNTITENSGWDPLMEMGLKKEQVELYIEGAEIIPSSYQFEPKTFENGTQTVIVEKCTRCQKYRQTIKTFRQKISRKEKKIAVMKNKINTLRTEFENSKKRKIKVVGNNIVLIDKLK